MSTIKAEEIIPVSSELKLYRALFAIFLAIPTLIILLGYFEGKGNISISDLPFYLTLLLCSYLIYRGLLWMMIIVFMYHIWGTYISFPQSFSYLLGMLLEILFFYFAIRTIYMEWQRKKDVKIASSALKNSAQPTVSEQTQPPQI